MTLRPDPFALDDVKGGHNVLAALGPEAGERLLARVLYGESPLCAGAELVRRREHVYRVHSARALVAAAAFMAPEDLGVLARLPGGVGIRAAEGTDALAAVLLAPGLPALQRVAAAEALAVAPVTAAGYAALAEVAEGGKKPPWSTAIAALAEVSGRADKPLREEVQTLRSVAQQIRDRVRGELRRQEFQRAVASGTLHPVVGALAGDADFLPGLLPPIADVARELLLPWLLVAVRQGTEAVRAKVLGLFHRRWRDVAAGPLSLVARTPGKARDASIGPAVVRALGTLGALDEVTAVLGAMSGAVRAAALGELERALPRARAEIDPDLLAAALARAGTDPEAAVRTRAHALLRAPGAAP